MVKKLVEQDRGTPGHRYTNLNTTFLLLVGKYNNALINDTKEKENVQWCFKLGGEQIGSRSKIKPDLNQSSKRLKGSSSDEATAKSQISRMNQER